LTLFILELKTNIKEFEKPKVATYMKGNLCLRIKVNVEDSFAEKPENS